MDFTAFCRNLFLLLHPPVENIGLSKEKRHRPHDGRARRPRNAERPFLRGAFGREALRKDDLRPLRLRDLQHRDADRGSRTRPRLRVDRLAHDPLAAHGQPKLARPAASGTSHHHDDHRARRDRRRYVEGAWTFLNALGETPY